MSAKVVPKPKSSTTTRSLPVSDGAQLIYEVITLSDVIVLSRELLALEEAIQQRAIARKMNATVDLPHHSTLLSDLAEHNGWKLIRSTDRKSMMNFIKNIVDNAPVIHVTFAKYPSDSTLIKLSGWFREHVDPLTLLSVQINPAVIGGCTLRTTNKYFDFSLGQRLGSAKEELKAAINNTGISV